jgi:hypothetical protein
MKVTKAKGLKTDLSGSLGYNPRSSSVRLHRSLAAEAMHPRKPVLRAESDLFVVCRHVSEPDRISPFALATFIWGRK